jgi:hypothetical protein
MTDAPSLLDETPSILSFDDAASEIPDGTLAGMGMASNLSTEGPYITKPSSTGLGATPISNVTSSSQGLASITAVRLDPEFISYLQLTRTS